MIRKSFWVIGAGTFGSMAVRELNRKHPGAIFTVVDIDPEPLRRLDLPGIDTVCADGAVFLFQRLDDRNRPDWIVPAVPVHLLREWLQLVLPGLETMPVPDAVLRQLPNPIKGEGGALYTSIADFMCPPDCPEPPKICTCTGRPRPYRLYEHIQNLAFPPFQTVVVQSRQLLPGVGGYRTGDLREALGAVESAKTPVLLATACKCHGVVHALLNKGPAEAP
ncbi:MAG: NAD-binding protein [Desulfobacteraceae bacterium]|nr:NAD-binding protein [Desulfobacteraceae bacterium]